MTRYTATLADGTRVPVAVTRGPGPHAVLRATHPVPGGDTQMVHEGVNTWDVLAAVREGLASRGYVVVRMEEH